MFLWEKPKWDTQDNSRHIQLSFNRVLEARISLIFVIHSLDNSNFMRWLNDGIEDTAINTDYKSEIRLRFVLSTCTHTHTHTQVNPYACLWDIWSKLNDAKN